MQENKAVICRALIEAELLQSKCAIASTYDMSHVVIYSMENRDDYERCPNPTISQPDSYYIDEDEQFENAQAFKTAKAKIEYILASNDCVLETTYDMSYSYIYDSYGNSDKIK